MLHFELSQLPLLILNFAVAVLVLYFLLFKPVMKIINERKALAEAAEKRNQDLEKKSSDFERDTVTAKANLEEEMARMRDETGRECEQMKSEIKKEAEAESLKIRKNALTAAKAAKKRAVAESRADIISLSVKLASQIMEKNLDECEKSEHIDRIIDGIIENYHDDAGAQG